MKNIKLSIVGVLILGACSSNDENTPALSDTELLTGGSQKEWVVTSESPEDEFESCRPTSPTFLDNTYTFFSDGKVTFDHGTITEDLNCQEAGCCSDLINFIGTWEFTNNGKNFRLVVGYNTDEPDNMIDEELYDLPFTITANELTISETQGGVTYSQTYTPK